MYTIFDKSTGHLGLAFFWPWCVWHYVHILTPSWKEVCECWAKGGIIRQREISTIQTVKLSEMNRCRLLQ